MNMKETNKERSISINDRTVTSFLEKEYKDYSIYVAGSRALIGLDGLKRTGRKVLYAALKGCLKNGEQRKVPNVAGDCLNLTLYPHGDTSLNSVCCGMAKEHIWNVNPLYIDSQNGTLRSDVSASARYLYVRLSKYADIWKTDMELCEKQFDEGQEIEYKQFLPICCTGLMNRQQGIGVGYAFSTMSYNPLDVIDASLEWLQSKKKEDKLSDFVLHPYIRGIKRKNWKLEDGKWVNYGEFTYNDKKKEIIITDLPYDIEFAKFEKLLNKFVENDEIKDWANYSTGESIEYRIDCKKGKFGNGLKGKSINQKIENKFKLRTVVPEDNLWVLDENNKIHHFVRPTEFIEYFTNWRLEKYNDRKSRLVNILEDKYEKNSELVKFIELVCKGKLKIRNRSKVDIKTDMDGYKLPMNLISTPMSKVTIEERDELLKENEAIKKELDYIKKTTIKDMYIKDLQDLRKELEKDFK